MAVARMHKQRTVKRENMRWDRQRPITRGGQAVGVVQATGATAGIPGTWTPGGSTPPADAAQATTWGVVASPATAWTVGQYVQGSTAGAPGEMCWTGSAWVGGRAP